MNTCPMHSKKKKKERVKSTHHDAWRKRHQKRLQCGMGIDASCSSGVFVSPYDDENPYLYQFSPYYAEFPYGPDYHDEFADRNNYLPSFPSIDSSTRVYYRDFPIIRLRVPENLQEDSMGT